MPAPQRLVRKKAYNGKSVTNGAAMSMPMNGTVSARCPLAGSSAGAMLKDMRAQMPAKTAKVTNKK